MRAGEQPVNQPLVGVGRTVVLERFDLRRIRRQPQQIEREPPDQACAGPPPAKPASPFSRSFAWTNASIGLAARDAAYRRSTRHIGAFEPPQRPPIRSCLSPGHFRTRRVAIARVRCTHLDPLPEVRDHALGEPAFRRHPLDSARSRDRLKKQTLIEVARFNRRSAVPTGSSPLASIKPKPPAQLLGRA